jgi:hypothetical protein
MATVLLYPISFALLFQNIWMKSELAKNMLDGDYTLKEYPASRLHSGKIQKTG